MKSYEKSSFTAMVMGTVSGVLFAVGMCIALLPEWGAFNRGIMTGCCFFLLSFLLIVTVRKMNWIFPYRCSKISTETRTELNTCQPGSGFKVQEINMAIFRERIELWKIAIILQSVTWNVWKHRQSKSGRISSP